MSAPAGASCPGCGELAEYVMPGGVQAFCGNKNCRVFAWDMDKTPEELIADMGTIDLTGVFQPAAEPGEAQPAARFVFAGPSAPRAADMIRTMTRYLAGPGFNGFLAWLDQGNIDPCICGQAHAPDAGIVRSNLENLGAIIAHAIDHPETEP